jgi:hypothetical protein
MSSTQKYAEQVDKENAQLPPFFAKKEKLIGEEPQIRKTVLGESSQPKVFTEEPTSPEDTKLLARKREIERGSALTFAFKLNFC